MQGRRTFRFNYAQISVANDNARPHTESITLMNSKKMCICNQYNVERTFECFKCGLKVHYCVKVQKNRPQINSFECLSCLAKAMDLVYEPRKDLLETFYKTQNIFQQSNTISFQFHLQYEDTKFPVDVRGFKGSKIELAWPMQGEFIISNGPDKKQFTLKPLKSNSNRTNRKEDCFLIQPKFLREGKNVITFRIARLNQAKVQQKYQYEQTGVYFIAIYSVRMLKNNEVLNMAQQHRRFEKYQTIELFNQGDEDVPADKQKVRLVDPYTGQRIRFPVRGRYCRHLATVCLLTYIQFQRNSRSWKCPICSNQLNSFLNEPYLDVWMHEILQDNSKRENVIIYPDGTYEWEPLPQVAVGLDSDQDSEQPSSAKQLEPILEEEQAVFAQFEFFDLDSHSQQPQQIDLIDYDDLAQITNPQNDIWTPRQVAQSEGELTPEQEQRYEGRTDFAARSQVGDPIIEEFAEMNQPQSDENSEFEFPFNNNDFVPSSKLENIKVQPTPIEPEKKESEKTPEIYKIPLEIGHKKNQKKIESIASKDLGPQLTKKMNLMKQKILEKTGQNVQQKSGFNPQKKQSLDIQSKIQTYGNDKFIGDKRLIPRPTFIQTVQQRPKEQYQNASLSLQRQNPFGIAQRKNIELSQQRMNKSQPKIQQGLGKFFPLPKQLHQAQLTKKSEQKKKSQSVQIKQGKSVKKDQATQQKPKLAKIKTIKVLQCQNISHAKFVKDYCRIPIPRMFQKLNEDLRKIFAPIL